MVTLRVQTYNVHLFPPWLVTLSRCFRALALDHDDALRLRSIAEALLCTDAAVVLLTEVWDDRYAADLIGLFRGRWPFAARPHASEAWRPLGSGLLLVSKLELSEIEFHPFSRSSGVDRLAGKGMLYARLAGPRRGLGVLGLHMQANYAGGAHEETCLAQVSELLELAANRRVDVVLGDFNQAPGTPAFSALAQGLAALGLTSRAQAFRRPPSLHGVFGGDSAKRFQVEDHIFARSLAWALCEPTAAPQLFGHNYRYAGDDGGDDLSDHLPLLGEILIG